jgi:hypothetical protein
VVYALLKSGIAYDGSMIEHAIERRREQAAHAARRQQSRVSPINSIACSLVRHSKSHSRAANPRSQVKNNDPSRIEPLADVG